MRFQNNTHHPVTTPADGPTGPTTDYGLPPVVLIAAPTFGAFGGIEAFTLRLVQALHTGGRWRPWVAFKRIGSAPLGQDLRDALTALPFPVLWDRQPGFTWPRLISQAAVVHCQNAIPAVCLLARGLGKPLVVTQHNRRMDHRSLASLAWRTALRMADRRWYNSSFVARSWEGPNLGAGSAVVPTVSDLRLDPTPWEGRRGFLCIGRLVSGKGVDLLLRAYAALPLDRVTWPLTILGTGAREAEWRRLAADLGLPADVLRGFVPTSEKWRQVRSAKWLVAVPQTPEDMGLTPLEARSQAVPCIVSRDGGLPEAAGPEALTCRPGDVPDLAAALLRAAHMPEPEYRARAGSSFAGLRRHLVDWRFYERSYRGL